jgi:flavorubredoxin
VSAYKYTTQTIKYQKYKSSKINVLQIDIKNHEATLSDISKVNRLLLGMPPYRQELPAILGLIQKIRPPLHDLPAFVQVTGVVNIGCANFVMFHVGHLPFDGIRL